MWQKDLQFLCAALFISNRHFLLFGLHSLQCNSLHAYLGVSLTVLNGAFSQGVCSLVGQ